MSQIIIIERVAALAEQIEQTYLHHGSMKIKQAVLVCLHPIEVPSDAGELAREVVNEMESPFDTAENRELKSAALITAHSRTVPRAMLEEYAKAYFTSYELRIDQDNLKERTANFFAAKYGYRAE